MSTPEESAEADMLAALAARFGLTPEQALATLKSSSAPTVAEFTDDFLKLQTVNTRRSYSTHLLWFRDGIEPTCDQLCEPCMDVKVRFACRCDCSKCDRSRISLEAQGPKPLSEDSCSKEHVAIVAGAAHRVARKRGIVENRRRAKQGKPTKEASGFGAQETAIAGLRYMFTAAKRWVPTNHAQLVKKPHRVGRERRALRDFEFIELCHVTETGGSDPDLDSLIVEYGIATGARRLGVYSLTGGQIHQTRQMISLVDKFQRPKDAPVSAALIDRLLAHALERGGPVCDPNSPTYRPDSPVFYAAKRRAPGEWTPLTARYFDKLHERWQRELLWASEEQVGFHHLRHTMSERLKGAYGQHVAQRYLRHANADVTDGYGRCTTEDLARALSEYLGFEHPLVHGIDKRRRDSLDRYGYGDPTD